MEVPVPQDPAEMDDDKDPKESVQSLKLSSTEVDLKTVFYAVQLVTSQASLTLQCLHRLDTRNPMHST